jgi:hypothetical protein
MVLAGRAIAGIFTDDFSAGLNADYWLIETNQPLYSVDTAQGGVSFTKPVTSNSGFQYAKLTSRLVASGDFDAQVDFGNALLTHTGGGVANQVELVCYFGGRVYYVIRSDESSLGPSVHVRVVGIGPSAGSFGVQSWEAAFGTLRMARSRGTVSFWVDSTLLHQWTWNSSPATFAMFLVNNGTRDATSVTFDNFRLSADEITYPPLVLSAQSLPPDNILLSWPAYPPGYVLETTSNLTVLASWQKVTNIAVLTGGQLFLTNTTSEPAGFYRLRQEL